MADAGAIGTFYTPSIPSPLPVWGASNIQSTPVAVDTILGGIPRVLPVWEWGGSLTGDLTISVAGSISGHTYESGAVKPYTSVRLYNRFTGTLIYVTNSGVNGAYQFGNLIPGKAYVVVAVYDKWGVQGKNAVVIDEVLAV